MAEVARKTEERHALAKEHAREQHIPLEVLARAWPPRKVVMGMRVCRWMRDQLPAYADCVELTARKCEYFAVAFQGLKRFCQGRVRLVCNAPVPGLRVYDTGISDILRTALFAVEKNLHNGFDQCLTHLDLSRCRMGGDGFENISTILCQCTALEALNLDANCLGPPGLNTLAGCLSSFQALRTLDVQHSGIGKESPFHACEALSMACAELSGLAKLRLGGAWYRADGARGLAVGLGGCTALTQLHIDNMRLEDSGMQELAPALGRCNSLTHLDLSSNFLHSAAAKAISAALGRWDPDSGGCARPRSALTELRCRHNTPDFGHEDACYWLASGLAACKRLRVLDLSGSHIRDSGVQRMVGRLPCAALVHLELRNNKIGSRDAGALVLLLQECAELAALDLADNCLGDEGVLPLAEQALKRLRSLASLDIAGNRIGDVGATHLGAHLSACPTLTRLHITRNRIEAEGGERLLSAIASLGNRIEMDIRFRTTRQEAFEQAPAHPPVREIDEKRTECRGRHDVPIRALAPAFVTASTASSASCLGDR